MTIKAECSEIQGTALKNVVPAYATTTGLYRKSASTFFTAESGGCWDLETRRCFSVLGGGHADGYYNIAFGTAPGPGPWEVLDGATLPEIVPTQTTIPVYPDGRPPARHTYAGTHYLHRTGVSEIAGEAIWICGGARWNSGTGDNIVWLFDLATKKYHNAGIAISGMQACWSAYDHVTDEIWARSNGIIVYEVNMNRWRRHSAKFPDPGGSGGANRAAMTIDEVRRHLWWSNLGSYQRLSRFSMESGAENQTPTYYVMKGDAWAFSQQSPGFAWDPELDSLVAYGGGPSLTVVNLTTFDLSRIAVMGTDPGVDATHGTFNRFARVGPEEYLCANRVDQNILRFRLWRSTSGMMAFRPGGLSVHFNAESADTTPLPSSAEQNIGEEEGIP